MGFGICVEDIFKLDFGHAPRDNHLYIYLAHAADFVENLLLGCIFDSAGVADIDLCLICIIVTQQLMPELLYTCLHNFG
jgi:hypothetical protein